MALQLGNLSGNFPGAICVTWMCRPDPCCACACSSARSVQGTNDSSLLYGHLVGWASMRFLPRRGDKRVVVPVSNARLGTPLLQYAAVPVYGDEAPPTTLDVRPPLTLTALPQCEPRAASALPLACEHR